MEQDENQGKALTVEEVLAAVSAVRAETAADEIAAKILACLNGWAKPALVLCVERDAQQTDGWRAVASLSQGALPQGLLQSITRLVDQAPPGTFSRPTRLRPTEDAASSAPADNLLVPWRVATSSGIVFLRGLQQPYPSNLGDALALLIQEYWTAQRGGRSAATAAPQDAATIPIEAAYQTAQNLALLLEKMSRVEKQDGERIVREHESLRARATALEQRADDLHNQFESARGEIERSRRILEEQDHLLETRTVELEETRARLKEALGRIDAEVGLKESAQNDLDTRVSENESLKRRVQELESQPNATSDPNAAAERDAARNEVEALKAELAKALLALSAEKEQGAAAVASAKDALQKDLAACGTEITALQHRIQ
ncbi:MAG: hypothetical protein MUF51_11065, partial [Vicinamibacteria bacterium]|nr:hypothetical protein [Vicinamibacteria bacterium]